MASSPAASTAPASSETQLFRTRDAKLFLIDGDESALMQAGDFSLFLVEHCRSPLAAVLAAVGDVQWPVGKDSLVVKLAEGRFSFSLPGPDLIYGVDVAAEKGLLEVLLGRYSTFEEISAGRETDEAAEKAEAEEDAAYWRKMAVEVEKRSARIMFRAAMERQATTVAEGGGAAPAEAGVSARMHRKMQQARRISAVAKLFSKTLAKGAISAAAHVEQPAHAAASAPPPSDPELSPAGGPEPSPAGEPEPSPAMAGIDAVVKVVEAVETAGRTLLEIPDPAATLSSVAAIRTGSTIGKTIPSSGWTLNTVGLRMLFRAIAASTALSNSGSGSSSSSSGGRHGMSRSSSSSSDMSSSRRLFTSPSASSSSSASRSASPQALSKLGGAPMLPSGDSAPLRSASLPVSRTHPLSPSAPPSSFRLYRPRATSATSALPSVPHLPPPPPPPPPPQRPPHQDSQKPS